MSSRCKAFLYLILSGMLAVPAPARAAGYDLDPAHSFIQFRISHLGYSVLTGRFNRFTGAFTWDAANPAGAAIEVTVDAASVDTNHEKRDQHVRSADFLDVAKYPQAVFKSTKYAGDARGGTLEGTLTLHGVTRPLTLSVQFVGEGPDPWGGYRAGFTAHTTLRRADFGIAHDLGPAAETMEFDLFVEGTRRP